MSYLNRVWMVASVAVVQGRNHTDRDTRWNSGKDRVDPAGIVPITWFGMGRLLGDGSGEERRKQADDSLRKAMYISCWGPS